jgi:hypothetical protein
MSVPKMVEGRPDWWHKHGYRMKVGISDCSIGRITVLNSAASLNVVKRGQIYCVNWKIFYSESEETEGKVNMSVEELMAAFCARDVIFSNSKWLVDRYGATAACQGSFIRFGPYLNIPCPGTGCDGDPNISILIDCSIKKSIRDFVNKKSKELSEIT